jgi:hypothetical protein
VGLVPVDCRNPGPSDVEVWAAFHAAYAALDRWVIEGVPPAIADPIPVASLGPPVTLVRDADGIALRGIRLPKVTVPVAVNNGANAAASLTNPLSVFCVLTARTRRSARRSWRRAIRRTAPSSRT